MLPKWNTKKALRRRDVHPVHAGLGPSHRDLALGIGLEVDLAELGGDGTAASYAATLLNDPHFLEWEAEALAGMKG